MKIAQIAPVWERVPPRRYGGIELVVHLLTEELVKRGHEVTLFATGDSVTSAKLVSWYHTPPPRSSMSGDPLPNLIHTAQAFKQAEQFDILHNHTGYMGIVFGDYIKKPVLNTLHGDFTEVNHAFYEMYKNNVFYNSISLEQRKAGPELNYAGNVYNAINIKSYSFSKKKKDFFVYISRISKAKGSDIAVDVALKAGVKLIIAGKIDPGKNMKFFEEEIAPKVDNKQIIFKGEVSKEEKRKLFKEARGLIFPLQWNEPFGLVMVESMAAGTPVVSFPLGSVCEVVKNKETGFIVKNTDEMVEAVKRIDELNPDDCRKWVEKRFGVDKMVNEYEKIYKKILQLAS